MTSSPISRQRERQRERAAPGRWIALAALVALLAAPAAAQPDPPNLLIFLVDDLGIEHLSFYSSIGSNPPFAFTPKLEAWRGEWLQFYDAWSNPLCSPTRSTIHTGQYAFRTGVGKLVPPPPAQVWGLDTSLGHLLPKMLETHANPYTTAAFGKT